MKCVPGGAASRLRWALLSAAVVAGLLIASIDDAEARKRKRHHVKRHHQAEKYNPKHASIVLDVKSGATLQQANADALRHPASLTKVMTLYLLFERLEAGKLSLHSRLPVSEEAASQSPTRLGLREGQTLSVEDAIKGLITKSANDAAVVVAEALAGSEEEFARQMTRKARALGMQRTVYRNASGLPDGEQVTTAREQAMLGIAIQERFPRFYGYFSTRNFSYNGRALRNHNKLLGRVHGVDGIKTGYTRASGFNLVTSMRRGDRHIVAVVLGGRSGGERDARMRTLVEGHILEASARQTKTTFAEAQPAPPPAPAPVAAAPRTRVAAAGPAPAVQVSQTGSTEPIRPVVVKTVTVRLASAKAAPAVLPAKTVQAAPVRAAAPSVVAPPPVAAAPVPAPAAPVVVAKAEKTPAPARPGILGVLPAAAAAAGNAVVPAAKAAEAPRPRSGWAIQVGAYEAEDEAKQRLAVAKSKATTLLGKADPYTERTQKGDKTYFRARFAGFDRDQAEAACKQLKRAEIVCMALRI